jgi:hypothetical protein
LKFSDGEDGLVGIVGVMLAASLAAAPTAAQQVMGAPGSPSATVVIDGRQHPPPRPEFGGMMLDHVANRVVPKHQTSSCEQLKQMRAEPPSFKVKEALEFLHSDTQARVAFIDRIAAPVANKMFECGMFP